MLDTILHHVSGGVALRDIARILESTLTDWVPAVLEPDETVGGSTADVLSPEELVEVMTIASEVIGRLDGGDAEILHGQLAGLPDPEVAPRLGVSRPTLIKRRRALIDRIRAAAGNLDARGQERLMDEIALSIATPRSGSRSSG